MVNLHAAARTPSVTLVASGSRSGSKSAKTVGSTTVDRSPGAFSDLVKQAASTSASAKTGLVSNLGLSSRSNSATGSVVTNHATSSTNKEIGTSQAVGSTPVSSPQSPVRATVPPTVASTKIGFNALVPADGVVPTAGSGSTLSTTQHWYGADAADDAYWAKQPPAVQQLREIDDTQQRTKLATTLAGQGYQIDVPIMVWGWDAAKTIALRQSGGYSWVPSALQASVTSAPGLTAPGLTPYDPYNPPAGSIHVG